MLERDLIQSRGVKNTRHQGEIVGFEFKIRMPSYRGMAASLIDGISITVDHDRNFGADEIRWKFGEKEFSLKELQQTNQERWQLNEPATIMVSLPGGLTPGVHSLDVDFSLRMSYIPVEHQPSRYKASKKVTIIS